MLLKLYSALLPALVVLDLLWLGIFMKDFYRASIGHLMSGSVSWIPAILFYLVFTAGLLYFVVLPGIQSGSFVKTILMGAAFGFVAYATYDLTNQATLRDWPMIVTLVDIAWGTLLCSILATLGFLLR